MAMKTAKRYCVVVLMLMNLTGVIAVTGVAAGPPAGAGGPPQLEQQILQAVRNLQQSVNQISTDSRRSYYLTTGAFMGDEILSPPAATPACASGYHFASFWELFDTSN